MLTHEFITGRLAEVATERKIKLLYACESGSRAWGLASPDSDYDVRFIYRRPPEWYLDLRKQKDMIGPIMELNNELDLVGWDLRKFLTHVAGSNANVLEWLASPINYFPAPSFHSNVSGLADTYFQPSKVAAHYLGIARSAKLAGRSEDGQWNLKKYFYFIRPVLAAEYVIKEQSRNPITFDKLKQLITNADVTAAVKELVDYKQTVKEDHRMQLPSLIENYFDSLFEKLSTDQHTFIRKESDYSAVNSFFRATIGYS